MSKGIVVRGHRSRTIGAVAVTGMALLASGCGSSGSDAGSGTASEATPSSSASATPSASTSSTPSASASQRPAGGASTRPTTLGYRWDGKGDPTATLVAPEKVFDLCGVKADQQLVAPESGTFHLGDVAYVGPKGVMPPPPMEIARAKGWRQCALGVEKQPVARAISTAELTAPRAAQVRSCTDHAGFDFTGWKVAATDTRRHPDSGKVLSTTLALTSRDGWLVGCQLDAGSAAAMLTFVSPTAPANACPVADSAPLGAPNKAARPAEIKAGQVPPSAPPKMPAPPKGAKPPKGMTPPPGMPPHPPQMPAEFTKGPAKIRYWVTVFGRVPAQAKAKKAASGGYNLGNSSDYAAMVKVENGVVIANHVWRPSMQAVSETNPLPRLNLFDRNTRPVFSCTPKA